MLAFTLVVSTAMALLFAWAPRLTFMNDPVRAMAAGGGRATGSRGRRRAQRVLVVSQLAASFMLLIGAGLLTRSLLRLYAVDPGFDLEHVLSLQAPELRASRAASGCGAVQQRRARARQGGSVGEERRHGVGGAAGGIVPAAARIPDRRRRRGRDQRRPAHRRRAS